MPLRITGPYGVTLAVIGTPPSEQLSLRGSDTLRNNIYPVKPAYGAWADDEKLPVPVIKNPAPGQPGPEVTTQWLGSPIVPTRSCTDCPGFRPVIVPLMLTGRIPTSGPEDTLAGLFRFASVADETVAPQTLDSELRNWGIACATTCGRLPVLPAQFPSIVHRSMLPLPFASGTVMGVPLPKLPVNVPFASKSSIRALVSDAEETPLFAATWDNPATITEESVLAWLTFK